MQNEMNDWREKIRNLDHVPGEVMPDKAEMWKRLQAKRFPKKQKKQHWIYWAAAAVLLLMILIPVALKDRNEIEPPIVKGPEKQDQQKLATKPDTTVTEYANTIKSNNTQAQQLPDQVNTPPIEKNLMTPDDKQPNIVNNQTPNNNVPVPDDPLLTVITPVDTPVQNRINNRTIRSFTLAKPPLRVVNIREMDPVLGQDSNPENDMRRLLMRRTETMATSGRSAEFILNNQN